MVAVRIAFHLIGRSLIIANNVVEAVSYRTNESKVSISFT